MTKHVTTLMSLVSSFLLYSQVGINTINPQTTFHIDGAKDNPATGSPNNIQQLNDFSVSNTGNVGIGTSAPVTKLDIVSPSSNAVRISDSTEGLGKVLTSDSNGYARWAAAGTSLAKLGTLPGTLQNIATIDDANISGDQRIAYSGSSIVLSPGKYQVNFTMWCAPSGDSPATTSNNGFASVFFSTSATSSVAPNYITPIKSIIIPRLYNTSASNPDYYGSGNIAVNITVPTTLYLWVYMSDGNWTTSSNRRITFRYDSGSYGPYVQLYAVPFDVE